MLVWGTGGGVVMSRAGYGYVCGTRGSGNVSSTANVLGMSVVRGMRGDGGVGEMGLCLPCGGVGDEWIRGLSLGFTKSCGNRESVGWVSNIGLRWSEMYRC